jgi:hypothetical protein
MLNACSATHEGAAAPPKGCHTGTCSAAQGRRLIKAFEETKRLNVLAHMACSHCQRLTATACSQHAQVEKKLAAHEALLAYPSSHLCTPNHKYTHVSRAASCR